MKHVDVVKRGKHSEKFDHEKVYKSVHAACLSVSVPDGLSHDTATKVTELVIVWLDDKDTVTTRDIKEKTLEALQRLHPDAGYMYKHHKSVL